MWACVRITESSFPAVHGSQFRRRRSLRPWNRPASIRMRLPDAVVRRWRDPVTVWAAPRKVIEATAGECHIRRARAVAAPKELLEFCSVRRVAAEAHKNRRVVKSRSGILSQHEEDDAIHGHPVWHVRTCSPPGSATRMDDAPIIAAESGRRVLAT